MRHRYTQADSKLNNENADHPQYPCPPGVMSCDSREPSSQEGHKRQDAPTPNMPTVLNYAGDVVGCEAQGGCTSAEPADTGFAVSGSNQNRYSRKVLVGGPSQGYRPRGSQDGDIPGTQETKNTSPLRQHNPNRGTVQEYDVRADTSTTSQPMHPAQRKASTPQLQGPQWKPNGPHG